MDDPAIEALIARIDAIIGGVIPPIDEFSVQVIAADGTDITATLPDSSAGLAGVEDRIGQVVGALEGDGRLTSLPTTTLSAGPPLLRAP